MKKLIALFLCLCMIAGIVPVMAESTAATHEISSVAFPYYDRGNEPASELTLYFLDGVNDLPYIEANDLLSLLTNLYHNTVEFSAVSDGSVVTYIRINKLYDTDVPLSIDFDKDTLSFADYNLFTMRADQSTMLDLTAIIMEDGAEILQKKQTAVTDTENFCRHLR